MNQNYNQNYTREQIDEVLAMIQDCVRAFLKKIARHGFTDRFTGMCITGIRLIALIQ
jgi:hypothetical protein